MYVWAVSYTHLVDHPMGGGEGRASGGHPRSRTGLYLSLIHISGRTQRRSKYGAKRPKAGQAAAPAKGKGKK